MALGEQTVVDRIIDARLKGSLGLAALASLLSLVRLTIIMIVPLYFWWWGAATAIVATLVLAGAIRLREGRAATG